MAGRRLVAIADCGHGIGDPLLSAFVANNHRVLGFSPSRESLENIRDRFWPAFDSKQLLDLWRTDLGNNAEVLER
eukprot:7057460-Pyramimonas_sp.AAC.1